jgi:hypothetical protein
LCTVAQVVKMSIEIAQGRPYRARATGEMS